MDATRCLEDFDPDFKYKTSNDSHHWITNYPDNLRADPNALKKSWTKEAFAKPVTETRSSEGKRKKLMEAFYRKMISEEVIGRHYEDIFLIEDYVSECMEKFKNPDDMPLPGEKLSKNEKFKIENKSCPHEESKQYKLEELKSKYPLYLSTPVTFFSETSGRINFRKNSTITKRPEDNYDNIEY